MLKQFFSGFFLLCCVVSSFALAGNANPVFSDVKDGKAYIKPGTITIGPDQIYLLVDHNFFPITGLFSDTKGLYIKASEVQELLSEWKCPKCGAPNSAMNTHCWQCGY